jgi:hypothetical protein
MSAETKKSFPEGAFAYYIEQAAGYLAQGLHILDLRTQGRIAEAQMLGYWIDEINVHKLRGILDERVEALRQQKESLNPVQMPLPTEDPEREINSLHIQQKRYNQGRLIEKDAEYEARQNRKKRAYTGRKKAEILRYRFRDAIDDLKEAGVWEYVERGRLDSETLRKIAAKMRAYRAHVPESSEGIAIYPDEESYKADLYDSE